MCDKTTAYAKTIRVIESCRDSKALEVAENYMHQYSRLYVERQDEIFHLAYILKNKQKQLTTSGLNPA